MKVYIMAADANNYQNLIPVDNGAFEIYREFNGSPLANPSVRLGVKILRDNERSRHVTSYTNKDENWRFDYKTNDYVTIFEGDLPKSDFPSLASHIPVFSERAVSVLNELLTVNGELIKSGLINALTQPGESPVWCGGRGALPIGDIAKTTLPNDIQRRATQNVQG